MQNSLVRVALPLARMFRALQSRVRGLSEMARRSKAPKVPATGTAAANVARFSTRATPLPPIALALQGGGAHGAFTWGVLDRLLAEPGLRLVAASGASAGALNAAVLASGLVEGGPDAARAKLSALWHRVSALARLIPRRPDPFEHVAPSWNAEWAFPNSALDLLMRFASPYQFNPLGLNPLRDVLVDLVDFERLRGRKALRLLIAATNVETSAGRIFANEELSPDVLLASACLPTLNQAVKLGDGYYWDGGFTANPPILPLVELGLADDLVLVRVNPTREEGVPTDPQAIRTRLSRIAFESPLKRELEIVERLGAMSGESDAPDALGRRLRRLRLHTVADDATMARLDQSSRLQPDAALMRHLAEAGRAAAGRWLEAFRTEVAMRPAARLERAG